jgi:hypothetical protein
MDAPPPAARDAAWTSVELAVAPAAVGRLLRDPRLLLRLNPCLEIEYLEHLADGRLRFAARNESNGCRVAAEVAVAITPAADGLVLDYSDGIKRETRLQVAPTAGGARLELTETYSPPADDGAVAPAEVDRSLLPWTAALRRHLERDARFGGIPGYRWLAESFWLSMSPRQRRVAWLIVWTTALEFAVFLAVLAIYLAAGR